MVELVDVDGHKLNKEALNLALTEYSEFRGSEGYGEGYKWKILEELNEWVEEINKKKKFKGIEKE